MEDIRTSMQTNREIHVAFLPVYVNPYQHLLTEALNSYGVDVIHLKSMPTVRWLKENRKKIDILHFHWLSGLYMSRYTTLISLLVFIYRVYIAHHYNYRIVWTAHNILPHNKPLRPIHILVRKLILRYSDAVIAHCNYGREALIQNFRSPSRIYVIPMGNYQGIHKITMTREIARTSLNITKDQFVYLMVGNISAYKGIEKFIKLFQKIGSDDDVVIIAGRNRAPHLVKNLTSIAELDQRIRIFPGYIPEDEMQRYLLASDVAVFSFEEILTSASVILCLTYGLPVIAPRMGCLPELITPEIGILYEPNDLISFEAAIKAIKEENLNDMSMSAKRTAQQLEWQEAAYKTRSVYLDCLNTE